MSTNQYPVAQQPPAPPEVRGPDFFIVGAPKCGTSSLHDYLRQHPDIYMPSRKDVPFFGSDLVHRLPGAPADVREYLHAFAPAPPQTRIGDSCTLYMQSRAAATEIAQWCPDASIVVMLRDPVDLMLSLHSHNIWMTEEDLEDFSDAISVEPERRNGSRIPRHTNYPAGLWYRDVASLGNQLERYLNVFGPDSVHVILFDELRADTRGVVNRTLEFLGLSTEVEINLDVVNERRSPRSRRLQAFFQQPPPALEKAFRTVTPASLHGRLLPYLNRFNQGSASKRSMPPDLRRQLDSEMKPQVELLETLLGRKLSGWCSSA